MLCKISESVLAFAKVFSCFSKAKFVCLLVVHCSLSRYKLKFSPDKVDTMVVQAIKILDELDKKVNNNVMTVKQWYGWHFPELEKNVTDNMTLVKTIQKLGKLFYLQEKKYNQEKCIFKKNLF